MRLSCSPGSSVEPVVPCEGPSQKICRPCGLGHPQRGAQSAKGQAIAQPLNKSATETQTLDEAEVASLLAVLQVAQQAAALADQLEQATTTVVVVLVGLEVLGELSDALGQQGDLDLGGASVSLRDCVLSDDCGRFGTVKRHVISLLKAQQPQQGTFGATTWEKAVIMPSHRGRS